MVEQFKRCTTLLLGKSFWPLFGPQSTHSRTKFWVKMFFCFFLRIESFWCEKCKKKFLVIFAHWRSPQQGWQNFFGSKSLKYFFAFFSRIESFWCQIFICIDSRAANVLTSMTSTLRKVKERWNFIMAPEMFDAVARDKHLLRRTLLLWYDG